MTTARFSGAGRQRDYADDPRCGRARGRGRGDQPGHRGHPATEPDSRHRRTRYRRTQWRGNRRHARCSRGGAARRRDHRRRPAARTPTGDVRLATSGRPRRPGAADDPARGRRRDRRHRAACRRHSGHRHCPCRRSVGRPPTCGPARRPDRLGDFSDITFGNLVPDAEQFTAQWQEIQFRFVDDPQGSVTEAADIIAQVTSKMEAAIQERQQAIEERQRAIQERASSLRGRWGEGSKADTETLRETLRMYRVFMDQLIGSRTSWSANRHKPGRVAASGRRSGRVRRLLGACRPAGPPWCARGRAASGAPRSGPGG